MASLGEDVDHDVAGEWMEGKGSGGMAGVGIWVIYSLLKGSCSIFGVPNIVLSPPLFEIVC